MSTPLLGSAVSAIQMGYAQMQRAVESAATPSGALSPDLAVDLALAKASISIGVRLAQNEAETIGQVLDILA